MFSSELGSEMCKITTPYHRTFLSTRIPRKTSKVLHATLKTDVTLSILTEVWRMRDPLSIFIHCLCAHIFTVRLVECECEVQVAEEKERGFPFADAKHPASPSFASLHRIHTQCLHWMRSNGAVVRLLRLLGGGLALLSPGARSRPHYLSHLSTSQTHNRYCSPQNAATLTAVELHIHLITNNIV